jgi:hypothetical protein
MLLLPNVKSKDATPYILHIKRLIEVSNKRGPELGEASEDIGIGLTCDCILVTEMSGVRWIAQNLKVEQ